MKKLISIIAALAACVLLTACNGTTEKNAFSDLELVRTGMSDRIVIDDLDALEKFNEIAVVGEFINDAETDVTYEYSAHFEKDIITDIRSYNTIKVTNVLRGDINVGDELTIGQRYGVAEGKLITFSDLTPMQKGDEWIFFLRKETNADIYWCCGDSDARFPTKISASRNSRLAFADSWQLGVYDEADFRQDIYDEIVEKYDV